MDDAGAHSQNASTTFDVAEQDFEQKVIAASRERPVVVDFWAPWCRPCLMLGPILERAVSGRAGAVTLAKINIDQAQGLAARYRIESIPAVIAFKDGQPFREFVGVLPESQVNAFLDLLQPSAADRLVAEAKVLSTSDPEGAEALYRRAVEQDPKHDEARLGLAELLLHQGKTAGVVDLLDPVSTGDAAGERARRLTAEAILHEQTAELGDVATARARLSAEPASAQRRYELGVLLAAQSDYAAALAELMTAAETDPKLAAGPVREAMVQVFHALCDQHPLANEYRAKLSRLLY